MNGSMWILFLLIIVVIVGLLLTIIAAKRATKHPRPTNYRAFFIMGIIMFPVGLGSMLLQLIFDETFIIGFPITALGLVYLVIGLANRDKWGKPVEVSPTTRKTLTLVVMGLAFAFILGAVFFYLRLVS
ncbi:hypothetical protein [[Eubacterium] cellulosolvens]